MKEKMLLPEHLVLGVVPRAGSTKDTSGTPHHYPVPGCAGNVPGTKKYLLTCTSSSPQEMLRHTSGTSSEIMLRHIFRHKK